MTRIAIILPFPGTGRYAPVWAHEERAIDWRRDHRRAARCTLAYTALELKHFLERTLRQATVTVAESAIPGAFVIELRLGGRAGFTLAPTRRGVRITGAQRDDVLAGAYEFLRCQGWRWYAPGQAGEVAPPRRARLVVPRQPLTGRPALTGGRGFDFGSVSMESAELVLWMARNRLNCYGDRPATRALARKLGLRLAVGGHIFEAILAPDRVLSSGRTLWDAHRNWYGQPAAGKRNQATALGTQFCVSQPGLVRFLARELLERLRGVWRNADHIAIWGFDTWGATCACPQCRALGNAADATLYFLGRLRHAVDAARLDYPVQLSLCAYEGTATLTGPQRPVPANLLAAGDSCTFYPINRCYAHALFAPACATNTRYAAALRSWTGRLPVTLGEYYNVSKFEDLPLLFTRRLADDLPAAHAAGVEGVTFMHLPLVNWAMRTLTYSLYAQLAWDVDTDVGAFVTRYFRDWYGPHAVVMCRAYDQIENAGQFISQWRAWSGGSGLSRLLAWNGRRPAQPLCDDPHLKSVVAAGRQSCRALRQALQLVRSAQAVERQQTLAVTAGRAMNPVEARRIEQATRYATRLGEDRRLLIYGLDAMTLLTELAAYHEALRTGQCWQADRCWRRVEAVADRLDGYYIPIGFEWPGAGLESKDALTRTQLRPVLARCRHARRVETRPVRNLKVTP